MKTHHAMRMPRRPPPVGQVDGKRVVVTGASRGLGHVIAWAFSHAGARVALVARTAADLEAVAVDLPGEVLLCPGDVRDAAFNDAVAARVVEQWGGLDVWIANAGVSPVVVEATSLDPAAWREVLDVNVSGAFFGACAAARVMAGAGRIIVTGSVLGDRALAGLSAYAASKAAVLGWVRALALELGAAGVTVNVVAPGWFESPLTAGFRSSAEASARIVGHTALGRWGVSEDLAGAYLFLASDAAAFVTGTVITVDGGYLLV
jgi:NAD(P)-dependent dehydrogenase (short-subunit alcohol dehydrogenase family)